MNNLKPFKRFCITLGEIPSSYIESMSYYETLVWLCNYLNKIIEPSLKETQEAVIELQEFVSHYFDNLDVQEEINNKLDEMAESGQLTDIIAQYLQLAGVLAYNTIDDMTSAENIAEGSICYTLGQNSYNDKKGAFYKVRTITSIDVVDNFNIVALDVSNTLIAERIKNLYTDNNELNVKIFGALGDGETDDTEGFVTALSVLKSNGGGTLFIPTGTYIIGTTISIPSNIIIKGDGKGTIIKASDTFDEDNPNLSFKSMFIQEVMAGHRSDTSTKNITIKDLIIDNNNQSNAGHSGVIQFRGIEGANVDNVEIRVSGENCWGIILFSANIYVNVNNVYINNNSDDANLGGCLWVRSGFKANNDTQKSYGIHITNSLFTSTAKDEVVVVADGVAGGWTECDIDNCTIIGKGVTTYEAFLLVVNCVGDNTSHIKINCNNLNLYGKVRLAGLAHGYDGIDESTIDATYNNIIMKLDETTYGGIRSYYKNQIFNNCNIIVPDGQTSCTTCTILNSRLKEKALDCNVMNCVIDSTTYGCQNCDNIKNNIIYSDDSGVRLSGEREAFIENNTIYANKRGIYATATNNGLKNSIISGNYITRKDNSANNNSIGIILQYAVNTQLVNNRIIGVAGNTSGNYQGFNYISNITNSTITQTENNATYIPST